MGTCSKHSAILPLPVLLLLSCLLAPIPVLPPPVTQAALVVLALKALPSQLL